MTLKNKKIIGVVAIIIIIAVAIGLGVGLKSKEHKGYEIKGTVVFDVTDWFPISLKTSLNNVNSITIFDGSFFYIKS